MLAAIIEGILLGLFEFVLEAIIEVLAEIGFHSVERARESKTIGPVLRLVTYGVIGGLFGLIGSYILPVHVIEPAVLRVGLMLMSPISMGLTLCLVSWVLYRRDRREPFWSTEKFAAGAFFGAAYTLSRFYLLDVM